MIKENQIVYWRREFGLSQFEFAAAVGIPRWKIQLIEQGVMTPTKEERNKLNVFFKRMTERKNELRI